MEDLVEYLTITHASTATSYCFVLTRNAWTIFDGEEYDIVFCTSVQR